MNPSGARSGSPSSAVVAAPHRPPPVKNEQEEEGEPSVNQPAADHDHVVNYVDHVYFDSFPPGYRFRPLDEELILHYLKKKVLGEELPMNKIMEVNLYRHDPDTLAAMYRKCGEKELYFFTPRDRKYPNGDRPNRAAGNGYWKATGADKRIMWHGEVVGLRKALVYYMGKPPKGVKTNWIMHEYKVIASSVPPRAPRTNKIDMRLDDFVLCRIYKKPEKYNTSRSTRYRLDDSVPVDVPIVPSAGNLDMTTTNFNNEYEVLHSSPQPLTHTFLQGHYHQGLGSVALGNNNFGKIQHFDLPQLQPSTIVMMNNNNADVIDYGTGSNDYGPMNDGYDDHHGVDNIWNDILDDPNGVAGGELGCGYGSDHHLLASLGSMDR